MDTVDILFIAADAREFDGALRYWTDIEPLQLPVHWARRATWKNRTIAAIANGAGPRRAAQAATVLRFRTLVNLGFCGALRPGLQIGDIIVDDTTRQPRTFRPHFRGTIVSIDHIAQEAREKEQLRRTGAMAVEMESAGLAGMPFYCIKSVSDLSGESFANDLNAVLNPDGRMNIPKLLANACLKPATRIPELMRLQKRSKIASNTLGEFLESCEF